MEVQVVHFLYNEPSLTLAYFTVRSEVKAYVFEKVQLLQLNLIGETCIGLPN